MNPLQKATLMILMRSLINSIKRDFKQKCFSNSLKRPHLMQMKNDYKALGCRHTLISLTTKKWSRSPILRTIREWSFRFKKKSGEHIRSRFYFCLHIKGIFHKFTQIKYKKWRFHLLYCLSRKKASNKNFIQINLFISFDSKLLPPQRNVKVKQKRYFYKWCLFF